MTTASKADLARAAPLFHGDPRAEYLMLEWDAGIPSVKFRRITYDSDGAVGALLAANVPNDFAEFRQAGALTPRYAIMKRRECRCAIGRFVGRMPVGVEVKAAFQIRILSTRLYPGL